MFKLISNKRSSPVLNNLKIIDIVHIVQEKTCRNKYNEVLIVETTEATNKNTI